MANKKYQAMLFDAVKGLFSSVSNFGNSLIVESVENNYGDKGYEWSFNNVYDLISGGVTTFTIDFSSVPSDETIFINPIRFSSSEEEVVMRVYEGADYSGGSAVVEPWNLNRKNPSTKDFIVTTDSVDQGGGKGTLLTIHSAFASSTGEARSDSGSAGNTRRVLVDTSKTYLVEFENLGATTTRVEYDAQMMQVPDEDL